MTFSPAEMSQPQIIKIPEKFKDFFDCRTVLAGSHRFPEIVKDFFAGRVVLAANHQYPENAQSVFRMQNCVSRKSSKSRKYSKIYWPAELCQPHVIYIPKIFEDFFACRIVLAANHEYPENPQSLFRMQNCVSRKSSKSRKYSKTYWPAELSQPHVICIPKVFKDFFACRTVLAGSHRFPEIFQDFFARRVVLAANHQYRESTQSLFARRIVLAANHHYPGNIQRLFRLQNCLSSKSLISRKYSKTFLACRIVLAANHQNPGNIRRLIGLLNCLSPMSSVYRKYSKTSSPAELSQQQIINIPEYSKTFSPAELSQLQVIGFPNYSKTFLPAGLSQRQIINIPKIFIDFFACRID